MSTFTWGRIIARFVYDFDGETVEATKFHPWKLKGSSFQAGYPDETQIQFHCEALRASFSSIQELLIAWIVYKNLGHNQWPLIAGTCRALEVRPAHSAGPNEAP